MLTMEPPTTLINTLYSFSFTTSLLASDLSTAAPSYQAYLDAAAKFKKEVDNAHALFRIAIESARNEAQGAKEEQEDKENVCDKGDVDADAGSPKRKLVIWSEHIAHAVETRLQNRIVPNIQRGFQAYLETQIVPDLEDRVLTKLKHELGNQPPSEVMSQDAALHDEVTLTLEPPPYAAHEDAATSETPLGKRSRSESSQVPGDQPGIDSGRQAEATSVAQFNGAVG
ncbi:hypothetical protein C8T65DRAFT_693066 [Cerioporus squamosus]|nr:hypothetical protein C8T65DRAFT_693066 [Cerioporus squamosus]